MSPASDRPISLGTPVRPSRQSGPPWRRGVVEQIADPSKLRSGMNIGVRVTEGALGYVGSILWLTPDEVEVDEGEG